MKKHEEAPTNQMSFSLWESTVTTMQNQHSSNPFLLGALPWLKRSPLLRKLAARAPIHRRRPYRDPPCTPVNMLYDVGEQVVLLHMFG